jgi:hypothetical protein
VSEAFLANVTPAALRALNYAPGVESLRRVAGAKRLGNVVRKIGGSFGSVFTRVDCDMASGVPLYSQVDTFAAEPQGRTIRRDCMPRPEEQRVHKSQILIAAAGQMGEGNLFGRSIIADERLTAGYCGPDTLALTFEEAGGDINLWSYAFLNTGIGLRAIRSAAYGTSIPRLRPDLVAQIPIPEPVAELQHRVVTLVRQCVEKRERSHAELLAARRVIEGLPEMREAHRMCAARARRAIRWSGPLRTLCAWNLASTGETIAFLRRRWSKRLGDVVGPDGLFNGPRFARVRCVPPHGVDFLSQRDAFLIRQFPRRIAAPGFDARLLFAREGTIMVGAQGTLGEGEVFGRAMMVHGRLVRSAFTQHLLRIIPFAEESRSLFAFLTTLVGMRLLRSTGVGTKLLSMRSDLLRDLPVPELSNEQRMQVDAQVAASMQAREAAEAAEQEAVRVFEEKVLPAWLG